MGFLVSFSVIYFGGAGGDQVFPLLSSEANLSFKKCRLGVFVF